VFATNQKLRNFKHPNAKQHYEDSLIHQLVASHFACATEGKTAFESGEIEGNGGVQKGESRKGEGGRRGGGGGRRPLGLSESTNH
jgi:hypothetical protein